MTGLQNIIDRCMSMQIDRRKVVGIQNTLNEIPRTSFTPTRQPWRITLEMPTSYKYSDARALLEALDTIDRYVPQVVTFSNNPKLSWIFAYQGSMTLSQINAITVVSYIGNQLVLGNLPVIASTRSLFEPNDLIQISGFPYPFTSTTEVLRGTDTTVTVTTNRPNILSSSVVGSSIVVGNSCQFNMFCPNMPVYKLKPGGHLQTKTGSIVTVINNAYIEFSSAFQLYEYVGAA